MPIDRDFRKPTRRAYRKVQTIVPSDRMVHSSFTSTSSGISSMNTRHFPSFRLIILSAIIIVVLIALITTQCSATSGAAEQADVQLPETGASDGRVSFIAVGDNLPDKIIGQYADSLAGETGDGEYDYAPLYEFMKPMVEEADLAYMKQETHIGGDEIGPRGWPSFNTTDDIAQALVDTGFDLIASASNHCYDWGTYGAVEHSREIWDAMPVVYTGTYASEDQHGQLALIERNGITFALLDYTYGVNGFTEAQLPEHIVDFIDEDRIRRDVERAKEASDVVLVSMHWGTENLLEADESQKRYAQLLAEMEVDVVLGSHPHVIGPMEWLESESGHKTLVAYSLGNFISHHDYPKLKNELEGALSCTFARSEDGDVDIEDVVWTPLVNHTEEGYLRVIPLKDYTEDLASRHVVFCSLDDPLQELQDLSRSVIGEGFTIDGYESNENEQ